MEAVYVLWIILLAVTVLVLPFIVALLHKVYRGARNIELYFAEMKQAGLGIAESTGQIKALDSTIEVASGILEVAGKIDGNAATLGGALAQRAENL